MSLRRMNIPPSPLAPPMVMGSRRAVRSSAIQLAPSCQKVDVSRSDSDDGEISSQWAIQRSASSIGVPSLSSRRRSAAPRASAIRHGSGRRRSGPDYYLCRQVRCHKEGRMLATRRRD